MGEPPAYSPFRTADRQRQYIIDNAGRESYTVELPDGSRVILRGGSQLEMAAAFSPTQRRVVLSGEGFFAITQDAAHPFAVLTPGGVNTSVLGTRFNLAAYGEDSTRISLVEGAIAVSWKAQTTAVSPGEQAVVDMAAGISTKKMSAKALREESDWSNDIFEYHDMEIEDVIKELARQYRLTPHFEGEITEKTRISAICSKSTQKLRGILANLKLYTHGLRFDVQGSQITVIANKKRHQ
jgi:ferric-dicitrate binding protein FerR (iron transport regulator)